MIYMSYVLIKILREQNILGLLCWLLCEGFPNPNELKNLDAEDFRLDDIKKSLHLHIAPINVLMSALDLQSKMIIFSINLI